jgi:hypothetical protein
MTTDKFLEGALLVLIGALCVFVRMSIRQNREHEAWRGEERRREERRKRREY